MASEDGLAPLCKCGCGQRTEKRGKDSRYKLYVRGHQANPPHMLLPAPKCACGCGKSVTKKSSKEWNKWLKGHHVRKHFHGYTSSSDAKINERLVRVYGITRPEYDSMLSQQNNTCYICGTEDPGKRRSLFCVDHCHTTGNVRRLLCFRCNTVLGQVDEDSEILRSMIEYLAEHND